MNYYIPYTTEINTTLFVRAILLLLVLNLLPITSLASSPTEVFVGLKIDQITGINQKEENFGVVASFRMSWTEPKLAFIPEDNNSAYKVYTLASFLKLLESKRIQWPSVSFSNLQGRVEFENQIVRISRDGVVDYMDRFTARFQVPDFNFKRFPLDHQTFFIHIDSIFSEDEFKFKELPGFSGVESNVDEGEWVIMDVKTELTVQGRSSFVQGSRFSFKFEGERHLNYYVIRILIPVLLLIAISWFTFFLQDYTKRIDLASTNLLMFIALNFTISNDLPRLGYTTLIDVLMVGTFIITSMVILVNITLQRLVNHGKRELSNKFDVYAIIGYPLAYILGLIIVSILFL